MRTLKCPECGTENPDEAEFCKKCGEKLEPQPKKSKKSKKSKKEAEPESSSVGVFIFLIFIFSILIAVIFFMGGGGADEVSATLQVSAEEWEISGDRYVHLRVFVKNNTDKQVKVQELKYFVKFMGDWGEPSSRKFPDNENVPPHSEISVGKLTLYETQYETKGLPIKVKVETNVGGFWTNIVEDYPYELV